MDAENLKILHGDALTRLRELPDGSVDCVVTSPPYWGLRDYELEPLIWEPEIGVMCEAHEWQTVAIDQPDFFGEGKRRRLVTHGRHCLRCRAWQGCFGLEPTIDLYLSHTVRIFEEVRRVLCSTGTLWLNLGDTYAGAAKPGSDKNVPGRRGNRGVQDGIKPKDMVGIPWRVALALQAAGWYLRSDIIWHKPSPMPESIRDRPTKAHEHLFLLAKSRRYHYDAAAIMEPVSGNAHARGSGVNPKAKIPAGWDTTPGGAHKQCARYSRIHVDRDPAHQTAAKIRAKQNRSFSAAVNGLVEKRNKRDVWTIASSPYKKAHFATFPPKLVEPCVLAGCRPGGIVLDPFGGSGTTGMVALKHGRKAILIEPSAAYIKLIEERCGKASHAS